MACNTNFVQFIADQCAGAGEIVVKNFDLANYITSMNSSLPAISFLA